MDKKTDYYQILHVRRDAPVEIIRASYRTLMQRLRMHPDLGGDSATAARLNEAYAILTDELQRAAYDAATQRSGESPNPCPEGRAQYRSGSPCEAPSGQCPFCGLAFHSTRLGMEDSCGRCASPLFPAELLRLEATGRRSVERLAREHRAAFYTRWPQSEPHPATARDVSPHGVQLLTRRAVDADCLVKIESELCSAVGKVVRCLESAPGGGRQWLLGIAFVTVRFVRLRGGFVSAIA